ncbi:MAG: universal stress protein [Myxococcota bacterium]
MTTTVSRILSPVDFSETSDHALEYAIELARGLGAELHLLHVYQLPMYSMPDGALLAGPDVATRIMDTARESLDALAQRLADRGVTIERHLTEGVPHQEIERVAKDIGADMVVMGTHGRTGLGHLLLGSVAERVVRTVPAPVLTVRHPESEVS